MMKMLNLINMDVTRKFCLLFYLIMIITLHTTHAGFADDMQSLENELEQQDAAKDSQSKSLQQMSTEELISELKKGIHKEEQKKSHTERFHDILSKKEVNDDFEKLLASTAKKSVDSKTKVDKKSTATQQKKSNSISTEKQSQDATQKKSTDTENETTKQMTVKKVTKGPRDPADSLVQKAISTMEELRNADVNDLAAQKKGLDLLQQLIDADKKASQKRSSSSIVEKIRVAKEDAEKRKTAKFQAALKADTALMKKLADEQAKKKLKKEAEKIELQKEAEHIDEDASKKETKKTAVTKTVEEIVDNKVLIKKGTLMDDVLNLMAEDLVKEIADKVAQKRGFHDRYGKGHKTTEHTDTCEDKRTDCHRLVDLCEDYKEKLKNICAKSCRFCESCQDKWTGKLAHRCHIVVNQGMCPRNGAENYCRKSCGYCKIPIQPKCSKTQFGCCWDKSTTKMDASGSNCKPCKNRYKFVCLRFKEECRNTNKAGTFMRDFCPKTCKVCEDICRDDPKRAFYCPFWKKDLKWCDTRKRVMKHFCPATCGLC